MPDELGGPSDFAANGAPRRSPSELALDAIRPLATLPVFFKLTGRRVVLAGGSEAAAWKAELLAAAGAKVAVFSPSPSPKMRETAGRYPQIAIPRAWVAGRFRRRRLGRRRGGERAGGRAFARAARRAPGRRSM